MVASFDFRWSFRYIGTFLIAALGVVLGCSLKPNSNETSQLKHLIADSSSTDSAVIVTAPCAFEAISSPGSGPTFQPMSDTEYTAAITTSGRIVKKKSHCDIAVDIAAATKDQKFMRAFAQGFGFERVHQISVNPYWKGEINAKQRVMDEICRAAREVSENGTLFFYFAGHSNVKSLALNEYRMTFRNDIIPLLNDCGSKRIKRYTFVMDTCFANRFAESGLDSIDNRLRYLSDYGETNAQLLLLLASDEVYGGGFSYYSSVGGFYTVGLYNTYYDLKHSSSGETGFVTLKEFTYERLAKSLLEISPGYGYPLQGPVTEFVNHAESPTENFAFDLALSYATPSTEIPNETPPSRPSGPYHCICSLNSEGLCTIKNRIGQTLESRNFGGECNAEICNQLFSKSVVEVECKNNVLFR